MIRQMSVSELKNILDNEPDAPLVDVREAGEFSEVRAPRARLHALSEFNPEKLKDQFGLAKDQTIYLICKSGGRSMRAAQILEHSGFTDLVNIEGGTTAWVQSGYETARD